MKFMILVKATKDSEAGKMPGEALISEMVGFHEEMAKAGVLVDGSGLHPSSKGARMEAKDGAEGFDFEGTYTRVVPHELIEYRMSDNRHVKVEFSERAGEVLVRETFDTETENSPEMQRAGWQAILDNFARHVRRQS